VSGVFTAQVVDADVDGPVVARGCLGWPVHPPAKLNTPDRQMAANSAEGI
jgi:predicted alpha/beta-hydrolase family hydrolase